MSSMLRPAGAFCAAALLLATGLFAADRPAPQTHVVEEIVAKVNGKIITRGELQKQRESILVDLQQQGLTGEALQKAVNARVADGLRDQVDQLLLVAKGKELSINVDADVNRRIAEIQSNSKISDPEKFHEWLHEQSGETFEDFKQLMTDKLLTERVISEEVYRNVNIPKADIEKYYNEHKSQFVREEMVSLREILVSVGDGSPDKVAAAEKKAKNIYDRIKKGDAKYNDMARQYSDAPTATSDGYLGSFKRGDLAKEIDEVVFKKDSKGVVTEPIKRPAGFEIYKVDEHYPAGQASLDEVQQDIQNKLMEPLAMPKTREYLTQLRQNAFLQIKPGYVDSGAAPGKDTSWQDATQLKPETTTKENVAASGHKKLFHVIPYGHVGKAAESSPAAPPTTTPVPQTPVPVTPQ